MDQRVQIVTSLIEDDLCREVSLVELARHVNLSPSRLSHLFKLEIGVSPTQYIKQLRMQRAKELLETTFLSVKEIMGRVGSNHQSHFARDFKRIYGVSPTKYKSLLHSQEYLWNSRNGL